MRPKSFHARPTPMSSPAILARRFSSSATLNANRKRRPLCRGERRVGRRHLHVPLAGKNPLRRSMMISTWRPQQVAPLRSKANPRPTLHSGVRQKRKHPRSCPAEIRYCAQERRHRGKHALEPARAVRHGSSDAWTQHAARCLPRLSTTRSHPSHTDSVIGKGSRSLPNTSIRKRKGDMVTSWDIGAVARAQPALAPEWART